MKKTLLIIAANAAFIIAGVKAQSPTPAPIAIPTPATKNVVQPVAFIVPSAQVPGLAALLSNAGITLPVGWKKITITAPLISGSNAGGLPVRIDF